MSVLQITARDFREKQKDYFDLADRGERVIIKRGSTKAYILTPVSIDDLQLTAEMELRIKESLDEIKEGNSTRIESIEALDRHLDSL
ncbi:MAG: prevent-host-death protein [Myroides sp.]|jgi:hypothetical protein|uniref:Antitoxin n=1 Tax=Myroides marinus TaxID=703342 RepID=A0A161U700_9FLAO|nr:hypothetical protein [Myroides marinus]MDR0196253.1 prevent-host-death protein [Myroides sp.]KUF44774.1 hypothetical protein AS361_01390 [Myroides marinus]KZE81416.1 hypothetical protein AV926_09030 [Myroides marinus]MDM1360649.1 hypothetical protein [Myroides marinus]SEI64928.1 hypothetical protein SAMN04488018_102434 [Myroides marinus]